MSQNPKLVTAVLGPTNTGKTHFALERMLSYKTGVIALPLRLLAREIYDKILALRGPSAVALITGEERIVPPRAQYWVATIEAMPQKIGAECVVIDEIQLCADPERGHVFTQRLLEERGSAETLLLGSDTMRGPIAALIPKVGYQKKERFSALSYTGAKKLSRMPARSAIVAFNIDNLYSIAEFLRRQKGGAAVVMGALSPRTRNAQVALYQNGDVDYLVATDAIGMGLNLNIDHVAFAGLSKFDGRKTRALAPNELAQIAGRAGRFRKDGTFGVTAEAPPLEDHIAGVIENHRFTPIKKLEWRNARLDFQSVDALLSSLIQPSEDPFLVRTREAEDHISLQMLASQPELRDRLSTHDDIRLLWNICQIPDFRKTSPQEHAALLAQVFSFLQAKDKIPEAWIAPKVARLDNIKGDIDALSKRLAFIRTWTYIAQRPGWVLNEETWREETRKVENRLSDALHQALTRRFVDRRTSILLRNLKERKQMEAEVTESGDVLVEGQNIGTLSGFRFRLSANSGAAEEKALRATAESALKAQYQRISEKLYNAGDQEFDITDQGGLMWGDAAVGRLEKGSEIHKPMVLPFVDEEAGLDVIEKVKRRLDHFVERKINAAFEPLFALRDDQEITGLARGVGFRLTEALGVLPRSAISKDIQSLDQSARGTLRKHGIRFGQYTIFHFQMLKPAPTRLRLLLWALFENHPEFPPAPPAGRVTIEEIKDVQKGYYSRAGFRPAGKRAIRIDMLERLADLIRSKDVKNGFETEADMLSLTGLTHEQFAELMQGLGYQVTRGERAKTLENTADAEKVQNASNSDGISAEAETDAAQPLDAPQATEETPSITEPPSQMDQVEEKSDSIEEDATEIYYTFQWISRGGSSAGRVPDKSKKQQRGEGFGSKSKKPKPQAAKKARPKKADKLDPDSPFAALAALKGDA